MRGCFVTGTDTGVGKTVVAAAIVAALRARGRRAAAFKPVVTGLDDRPEPGWPPDHELLAGAAGADGPEAVAPLRFGPAVSPHLAARLAGTRVEPESILAAAREAGAAAQVLVVEGVGGVLVPLAEDYSVRDFAGDLGLPVLVAARPGLGTINHTLLTLEALRGAGLTALGVVMTPWPSDPGELERSNRETIERIGEVEVAGLPCIPAANPAHLARAGESLPLGRWLGLEAT